MGSLSVLLLFVILVVIPAYFINRWMVKVTQPRASFKGLLSYILLSLVMAFAYTAVFIWILLRIYPLPKK